MDSGEHSVSGTSFHFRERTNCKTLISLKSFSKFYPNWINRKSDFVLYLQPRWLLFRDWIEYPSSWSISPGLGSKGTLSAPSLDPRPLKELYSMYYLTCVKCQFRLSHAAPSMKKETEPARYSNQKKRLCQTLLFRCFPIPIHWKLIRKRSGDGRERLILVSEMKKDESLRVWFIVDQVSEFFLYISMSPKLLSEWRSGFAISVCFNWQR
jgi:hypothetical protein